MVEIFAGAMFSRVGSRCFDVNASYCWLLWGEI